MALPSGNQPMELLNTMGNFNEKTINRISFNVLKIFNMYKESNGSLNFAEYNLNLGSIACGVTVLQCCWNEYTQRLTTFNANGVIVDYAVGQNETLYENMVNEKKKDPPIRVAWNRLGTRIGLVYADGLVIIGSEDGGPAFVRQFDFQLASFEWGPEDLLILGTAEGTVKVFDMDGEHQLDVYLPCLEAVELEHALAKRDYREEIVRMSYWSPILMSQLLQNRREENEQKRRDEEKERNSLGISIFSNYRPAPEPDETEKESEPVQPVPPDRPRFMVAYSTGVIQLMRNLVDRDPIVVRLPNLKLSDARWSPNGAFIAVCGSINQQTGVYSCLYFLSAYGQIIGFHQQLGSPFNTVSWETTGYRIAISAGGRLIIGQLRPQYKWGSIEDTLVYVYQNEEPFYFSVMFFDYETGEKTTKTVKYFENLACYKEHCVVIFREEDMSYHCDLCNSIGTAMDYVITNIQPKFVQVNGVAAVIASEDRYFIWYFNLPKPDTFLGEKMEVEGESGEYVLAEQQRPVEYGTKRLLGSKDQINSMCIGDTFFLIALRSGGIYRVNLSDGAITCRFAVAGTVDTMKLNCDFTKLALTKVLDSAPLHLYIYDFMNDGLLLQKSFTTEKTLIMDFQWDTHNPNMIAYKTNKELPGEIFVFDGESALKQGVANGFIYSFNNLVVTSVNLDAIIFNPDDPSKNSRIDTMIKAKSDVETMLYHGRLTEAMEYAEKSPHDELWSMIATYSIKNHQYDTAAHAFVKLQDYAGLQFVKKLRNISEIGLRNAEILAYEEKLEEAREMFVLCDRKDLAIEMYKQLDDPHQVSELLKYDNNEEQKLKAYRNLAEIFYEEMDWDESLKYFKKCDDIPMQIDCLVRANQFGKLEELVRNLDDDCEHLEFIGDIFSSRGLCDQAIESYLKCGLPKKAFDTCVEMHELQKAQFIAESHQLEDTERVLVKQAEDMVGGNG
ncbi:hypothetical protein CAEBREN_07258 [Caenorhabditis brenneri]|uniref:Uncharacterized protein n=1 Tax=Caenorhabditis brenneri TaxID=135651 RepID=G0P892_CAEBE|nr:hypothetical protein CAEBREN_07258 [Caenorhabditis brenneri]